MNVSNRRPLSSPESTRSGSHRLPAERSRVGGILGLTSRLLALWVIAGALAAYLWPGAFEWTEWPMGYLLGGFLDGEGPIPASSPYDLPGQKVAMWMFTLTMFAVGTVIEPRNFVFLARQPLPVLLGLLTQFTVMPSLAFLAARVGGFDDSVSLGFIIVGCAPGAMTSNLLTYLARGDTAYSVTLTTLASILAVVVTPLLVLLLAGEELGMSVEKFWQQLWTIAWTVATPLLLGLGLRALVPAARRIFEVVSPAVATLAIVVICCFAIYSTRDHLRQATASIVAGVVALNALGFLLGALLGRLYRLDPARRVTLSIEVGMQNAGMGVVLATTTFQDPRVAIPAAFFTIWCILTAAALIAFLKRRRAAEDAAPAGC